MKKKLILMLAACGIIGVCLAGCGKDAKTASDDATETEESSEFGSVGSDILYISEVQNEVEGGGFILNTGTLNDDNEPQSITQIFITLDESNADYKSLLTPGNIVLVTMNDTQIKGIVQGTDADRETLQNIRATIGTFENDMEYIQSGLTGSEVKEYANAMYSYWTDEQIATYNEKLAEMMQDEAFATSYNESLFDNMVMTAAERMADYEANPEKYYVATEPTVVTTEDGQEVTVDEGAFNEGDEPEGLVYDEEGNIVDENPTLTPEEQAEADRIAEENARILEEEGLNAEDLELVDPQSDMTQTDGSAEAAE